MEINCPCCKATLEVSDKSKGKRIICIKCGNVFALRPMAAAAPSTNSIFTRRIGAFLVDFVLFLILSVIVANLCIPSSPNPVVKKPSGLSFLSDGGNAYGKEMAAYYKAIGESSLRQAQEATMRKRVIFIVYALLLLLKDCFSRSPGKVLLGLRVINKHTGRPVGFGRAILRNITFEIPLGLLIELIAASDRTDERRIGDLIAGTLVVGVNREATDARKEMDNKLAEISPGEAMKLFDSNKKVD